MHFCACIWMLYLRLYAYTIFINFIVLDQATLGLQMTSFILLLFCLISCCITAGVYGPDEYGDIDNEFRSCFGCNCLWFYCNIGVYVITSKYILMILNIFVVRKIQVSINFFYRSQILKIFCRCHVPSLRHARLKREGAAMLKYCCFFPSFFNQSKH
jgi:hypothetical protein